MQIGRLDQARPFTTKDGSTIREVAGAVSLPTVNQSLAQAVVPAGTSTDAHYHVESEEIYHFTAGAGRLRIGAEESPVRAGDTVVIAPGLEHKLWADQGVDLELLCCCAPGYQHDDTVITEPAAS